MNEIVESKHAELVDLCRQYKVRQLELFGSAVGARFDSATSDLDFLVDFDSIPSGEDARYDFGLLFALQDLFKRDIDLVETVAISNPYFLEAIAKDRVILYAA